MARILLILILILPTNMFGQNINNWTNWVQTTIFKKKNVTFELPTFVPSVNLRWNGASECVMQLNYRLPNNFTIREIPKPPRWENSTPFILCIKFKHGSKVYRYKIWSYDEADYYIDSPPFQSVLHTRDEVYVPMYNGEVIKKNFTVEIWTTNAGVEGYATGYEGLQPIAFTPTFLPENPTLFVTSILKNKNAINDFDFEAINQYTFIQDLQLNFPLQFDELFPEGFSGEKN